jgi:predicted SnoaL-like aldol condensation-catalyzing enzyme
MAVCDDFYVNMRLASQMPLPQQRDTVLHFFEQVQKLYPTMTRFRRTDNGNEVSMEEERTNNKYRWVSLEQQRLSAGQVNPEHLDAAVQLHTKVLQSAPYTLSISPLEVDYLDVLFGFDLEFTGNHDEIIAESLMADSPLGCLLGEGGAKAVDFQPVTRVALSDDLRLQARIDVITRTDTYQVRTGDYRQDMISVYLTVRRYWGDRPKTPMHEMFAQLATRAEDLVSKHLLPRVLRPVHEAIASRS